MPFHSQCAVPNMTSALEIALGLMIPCMPSFATLWRFYADPNINDSGAFAPTPKIGPGSPLSFSSPGPFSQPESRATWRKTHLSIEEIPYRKSSAEYNQRHHIRAPSAVHFSRMKALPSTPLPSTTVPPSPGSPNSFRSMHLPIMLSN